jgi:hypothetical protein
VEQSIEFAREARAVLKPTLEKRGLELKILGHLGVKFTGNSGRKSLNVECEYPNKKRTR